MGNGFMRRLIRFDWKRRRHIFAAVAAIFLCGATGARAQLPSVATGPISVELEPVATGLNAPLEFMPVTDGTNRLFIVEQGGRIKVLKNGAVNATPFLDMSGSIKVGNEEGLLGLAFHPGFSNAGSPGFRKLYTY